MRKTDFLFIYEVKNRELENICLLKYELEKRGYSTELVETWEYVYKYHEPIEAKVVISFAMYNDDVYNYVASFASKMKKVVNLQWEQIFTNADDQKQSFRTIIGIAQQAVHICWGPYTVRKLVSMGVPQNNIELTGHIALDFLRPELIDYYSNRTEMCKKYSLPEKYKLHLFISSFSYVGMPEKTLRSEMYQSLSYDPLEFKRISVLSQEAIFQWFRSVLLDNLSDVIIYRPHPAEIGSAILLSMEKEFKNFFVISEESVKQWILIVDKVYTWYSTSVAEVLASGKDCVVLRPCEIPFSMDIPIYQKSKSITTYKEFKEVFLSNEKYVSLQKEILADYYYIDNNEPAYIKICDVLERVITRDEYIIHQLNPTINVPLSFNRQVVKYMKYLIVGILGLICKLSLGRWLLSRFGSKYLNIGLDYNFAYKLRKKNRTSRREIRKIQERIAITLK